MKRIDKLKILCAALVIVILGTFAASRIQDHNDKIRTGEGTILELSSVTAEKISWDTDSDVLSFHKEDDNWVYDYDENFPVDNNSINSLISDFADFEASFTIEDAADLGQYGLDDPICSISVEDDEGEHIIKLGAYSSIDEKRYVSIGDGNVYLAETDPYEDFNITVDSLMKDDEMPYSFGDEITVSFEGAHAYGFEYAEDNIYTGCSDDIYFTSSKHLALDTDKVGSYMDELSYLDLSTCKTYKATDTDMKKYGLDDPELKVSVEYLDSDKEEQTLSFAVGRKSKDRDDDDADAYFRMEGSSIIYEISGTDLSNILASSYNDLRHDELFTSDTEDIYKIIVDLDGEEYEFTGKGSGDDRTWYLGKEEVDTEDIISALKSITASEYTDEEASGKEEIAIAMYMKNDNVPEISFGFYRKDGESCIAKVNGKEKCTVERSYVIDLIEAVNALIL